MARVVIGGASPFRQCLEHGRADEISIGIIPALLGGGLSLLERTTANSIALEKLSILESADGRTATRFRVLKGR